MSNPTIQMIDPLVYIPDDIPCIQEPTTIEVAYRYANPPRPFTEADFPVRKKRRHQDSPDNLKLFFEDVEREPIIDGREQYLPLTRRILCKVIYQEVIQEAAHNTVTSLINLLHATISEFNALCSKRGTQELDVRSMISQIELFFDNPSLIMPEALSRSLANYRDMTNSEDELFVQIGWRAMYLLSLLSPAIRNYPLLSLDENIVMAHIDARLQEADKAQKALVSGTLRYITNVAATYIGRGLPYLDLISEGYFGLLRATETFREYMGGHFQQHAATWIHQKIGRALNDQASIIRQPVHLGDKLRTLNAEVERFQDSHGRLLYKDELETIDFDDEGSSDLHGGDKEAVIQIQQKRRELFPYLAQANGPHAILDLVDWSSKQDFLLMTSTQNLVESEQEYIHDSSWLRTFVETSGRHRLNDRSWQILQLRMGWDGGESQTLEEIAQQYDITRERVRQIEAHALSRLEFLKMVALAWFDDRDRHENILQTANRKLQISLERAEIELGSNPSGAAKERSTVEALIEQHIKRAHKGLVAHSDRKWKGYNGEK